MQRSEGLDHAAGVVEISWQAWGEGRVVVISHDLCEHGGRYGNLVDALVGAGYRVVAPDHRGHGRSGGERALIDDVGAAVADLATTIDRERAGPVVLLGQGMGAALAIALALRGVDVAGLVLLAPMLQPPSTSPVDATALSRDPDVVRAFEADPLVHHGPVPGATVAALSEAVEGFDPAALTTPFLLMHGYADRIADPEVSRVFHQRAGADSKVLVLWDGLFHEIFNEPAEDREMPLERLLEWLGERAG